MCAHTTCTCAHVASSLHCVCARACLAVTVTQCVRDGLFCMSQCLCAWVPRCPPGRWPRGCSPPPPPLQLPGNFSSFYCVSMGLSSPYPAPKLIQLLGNTLGGELTPTSSHRFRQVRMKHRKLREQVNSMVDISKVPGSRGGGKSGKRGGLGPLAGAWHTQAFIPGLWLNK